MLKMRSLAILCFAFLCLVVSSSCKSLLRDDIDVTYQPNQEHTRVKRFTCDVLSFEAKGVKLNDSACGIHCLLRGKRGGWCDGRRVCNCRN